MDPKHSIIKGLQCTSFQITKASEFRPTLHTRSILTAKQLRQRWAVWPQDYKAVFLLLLELS